MGERERGGGRETKGGKGKEKECGGVLLILLLLLLFFFYKLTDGYECYCFDRIKYVLRYQHD